MQVTGRTKPQPSCSRAQPGRAAALSRQQHDARPSGTGREIPRQNSGDKTGQAKRL